MNLGPMLWGHLVGGRPKDARGCADMVALALGSRWVLPKPGPVPMLNLEDWPGAFAEGVENALTVCF